MPNHIDQNEAEDRRKFLISCGRFAAVTPPAITLLLSTSLTSTAIAYSGAVSGGYGGRHSDRPSMLDDLFDHRRGDDDNQGNQGHNQQSSGGNGGSPGSNGGGGQFAGGPDGGRSG